MTIKYTYIGKGSAIIGVPARDLTEEDCKAFEIDEAEVIASGLYKKVETPKAEKKDKKAGE